MKCTVCSIPLQAHDFGQCADDVSNTLSTAFNKEICLCKVCTFMLVNCVAQLYSVLLITRTAQLCKESIQIATTNNLCTSNRDQVENWLWSAESIPANTSFWRGVPELLCRRTGSCSAHERVLFALRTPCNRLKPTESMNLPISTGFAVNNAAVPACSSRRVAAWMGWRIGVL